jgi:hypothetical protein
LHEIRGDVRVAVEHFVLDYDEMTNRKNAGAAVVVDLDFPIVGPEPSNDLVDSGCLRAVRQYLSIDRAGFQ